MIRFLLNDRPITLEQIDPNTTVLNYLRKQEGLTGTKEGCASGDCGACTVVLAEPSDHSEQPLVYRSINSCMTFIGALHGKQLITVEHLKANDQSLHKVQEAMVDHHGSQCGFCTPGIVMSLFAMDKSTASPDVKTCLSGNLCRCTGYQPILNAADSILAGKSVDRFEQQSAQTAEQLNAFTAQESPSLQHDQLRAFSPTSLDQLDELLTLYPDAALLAGGTDLALEVTQKHKTLATLIHLNQVDSLKGTHWHEDSLTIGSATSLTDALTDLEQWDPEWESLLHRFASLQIRNQGTLGGNIANASPIGDSPPALIAAKASITLRSGKGERSLPLESFFIDYKQTELQCGEYIHSITLPKRDAHSHYRLYKVSKRLDDDISAVMGAFQVWVDDGVVQEAVLAFGGMAAIPKRAHLTEQALTGQPWSLESIEAAAKMIASDFTPMSDARASQAYRELIAQNLLVRFFMEVEAKHSYRIEHYLPEEVHS